MVKNEEKKSVWAAEADRKRKKKRLSSGAPNLRNEQNNWVRRARAARIMKKGERRALVRTTWAVPFAKKRQLKEGRDEVQLNGKIGMLQGE